MVGLSKADIGAPIAAGGAGSHAANAQVTDPTLCCRIKEGDKVNACWKCVGCGVTAAHVAHVESHVESHVAHVE